MCNFTKPCCVAFQVYLFMWRSANEAFPDDTIKMLLHL
jgi:hypothetical protein